jgi:hypothetical protein
VKVIKMKALNKDFEPNDAYYITTTIIYNLQEEENDFVLPVLVRLQSNVFVLWRSIGIETQRETQSWSYWAF